MPGKNDSSLTARVSIHIVRPGLAIQNPGVEFKPTQNTTTIEFHDTHDAVANREQIFAQKAPRAKV